MLDRANRPKVQNIIQATAFHCDCPPAVMIGPERTRGVAMARHVSMYLSARYNPISMSQISKRHNRDTSVACYAAARIERLRESNQTLGETIKRIEEYLRAQGFCLTPLKRDAAGRIVEDAP